MTDNIKIHNDDDFESMRKAGTLASDCLDYITNFINPGISTLEIDKLCHDFQVERGAIPAPLIYKGFPKSICTSVNHVVCHGIPNENKILQDGDIICLLILRLLNSYQKKSINLQIGLYLGPELVREGFLT